MESMGLNFWKGKRVFLTGHTGFKGGWLAHWLHLLGADVCGFSLAPNTAPNFFELTHVEKLLHHVIGDIRHYSSLEKTVLDFDAEIVIHMAAQPLVIKSYESPIETFATNALGTAHLLEAARKSKSTKVVLVITTDKCYENNESGIAYREADRLGGHDPYSNSKACAELITQSFRDSFYAEKNVTLATARAGNVIGGGDWSENRLIPDIIRAITHKEKLMLRYPNAVRPWQHVLESLSGYLVLIEKCFSDPKKYSESWNFGPNDSQHFSVQQMVEKFHQKIARPFEFEVFSNNDLKESQQLTLNIDKALHKLGWTPKYNTEESIQKTVEWYNAWFNNEDMRTVTQKQIINYQEGIK